MPQPGLCTSSGSSLGAGCLQVCGKACPDPAAGTGSETIFPCLHISLGRAEGGSGAQGFVPRQLEGLAACSAILHTPGTRSPCAL